MDLNKAARPPPVMCRVFLQLITSLGPAVQSIISDPVYAVVHDLPLDVSRGLGAFEMQRSLHDGIRTLTMTVLSPLKNLVSQPNLFFPPSLPFSIRDSALIIH